MILVDANLLLYAVDTLSPQHHAARQWLEEVLAGGEPVRFSWVVILAFLRIATSSAALKRPLAIADAVDIVSGWLDRHNVAVVGPSDQHWKILSGLLITGQSRGSLSTDAHLAALAIEYGATVYTNDRDFSRFAGLRIVNPLTAA